MKMKLMHKLAALLTLGLTAGACGHHGCRGHHHREFNAEKIADRIADKLYLNDAQEKDLAARLVGLKPFADAMKATRIAAGDELEKQLNARSVDPVKLNKAVEDAEWAFTAARTESVTRFAEWYTTLNEKQKSELAEKFSKLHKRMKE